MRNRNGNSYSWVWGLVAVMGMVTMVEYSSEEFHAQACTSAIISGKLTKNGRPILWKHRDSGCEDNKVERIVATDSTYSYVALLNATDSLCAEAWCGLNEKGFAIMNTASYNLKSDTVTKVDCEGLLMSEALGRCTSVDDFEAFLNSHAKPLGVEANFGVIDAQGGGAYFEVGNSLYTRFDVPADSGWLVRTNYSYTGRKDEGYGYIREQNAKDLLAPHIKARDIEPATFTEELSRIYYHSLLGRDYTDSGETWLIDQDFIPRRTSCASCVIEGVNESRDESRCTMWVTLGLPQCAEVRAVWCADSGVPTEVRGTLPNGHSVLCDEAIRRKREVFPLSRGSGNSYLRLDLLYNAQGSGYAQSTHQKNMEYYKRMRRERK